MSGTQPTLLFNLYKLVLPETPLLLKESITDKFNNRTKKHNVGIAESLTSVLY